MNLRPSKESLIEQLSARSIQGRKYSRKFQKTRHVTQDLVDRLGLQQELEGHSGCVNCLEWNRTGSLLASGSDDKTVIVWCGNTGRKLERLSTKHEGNIFSVKFLPDSEDRVIATGAQDARVCLLDVEHKRVTQSASLHIGRVKRLAVAPELPGIFWSGSEDGTVMQWDTRERWRVNDPNVLVNLVNHMGRTAEVKCIDVCPSRPHLLAVGANDPYVRIYDRRKLSLSRLIDEPANEPSGQEGAEGIELQIRSQFAATEGKGDKTPPGAVTFFAPGHLQRVEKDSGRPPLNRPLTITYLAYSQDGDDLVVNVGGEQVYLYDSRTLYGVNSPYPNPRKILSVIQQAGPCDTTQTNNNVLFKTDHPHRNGEQQGGPTNGHNGARLKNGSHCGVRSPQPHPSGSSTGGDAANTSLPPNIETLKRRANFEFEQGHFSAAILIYNRAIAEMLDTPSFPPHPVLFSNRSAALLKRNWPGDMYAAMRDCLTALSLDHGHIKAHLRLARCLFELGWLQESETWLELFKARYPNHYSISSCTQFGKDLAEALEKKRRADEEAAANASSEGEEDPARSDEAEEGDPSQPMEEDADQPDAGDIIDDIYSLPFDIRTSRHGVMSNQEVEWRRHCRDYTSRFMGSCNTTTDIKEANFFGSDAQFVMAGSDDGRIFIWDRKTTNLVKILVGEEAIVNCVQGHPTAPILATSGIDSVVRIWHPLPRDGRVNDREVEFSKWENVLKQNRQRMWLDPFELFLRMDQTMETSDGSQNALQCRQS